MASLASRSRIVLARSLAAVRASDSRILTATARSFTAGASASSGAWSALHLAPWLAAGAAVAAFSTTENEKSTFFAVLLYPHPALGVHINRDIFVSAAPVRAVQIPPSYYQEVYNAVADLLDEEGYDDGSYGPVLVRLAWHAAGTYDAATGTGGSNGATMRFKAEAGWGANAGLKLARDRLERVKKAFPEISYSDLWSIAGVAAIQEMGGPVIPWRPGRADATEDRTPPDGRLPDATKKSDHLRSIFYRMGFNDREIVALSGAHALGRCHTDRSGFDGPWTRAPTTFSNDYFVRLLEEKWVEKKWAGPLQYVDAATGAIMMLPADLALIQDAAMRPFVQAYAADSELFFADFAKAFRKLEELGVPFKSDAPVIEFTRRA